MRDDESVFKLMGKQITFPSLQMDGVDGAPQPLVEAEVKLKEFNILWEICLFASFFYFYT